MDITFLNVVASEVGGNHIVLWKMCINAERKLMAVE